MRSQGKVSPVRELLEQLFDMDVRLDCEAKLRVSYGQKQARTEFMGMVTNPTVFLTDQVRGNC